MEESIENNLELYIKLIKSLVFKFKGKHINNNKSFDILNDLYIIIFDYVKNNPDKIIHNYIGLTTQILKFQLYNHISTINLNHFPKIEEITQDREYVEDVEDNYYFKIKVEENIERIFNELPTIKYWYDAEIFKRYYTTQLTIDKLSFKLKTPKSTLNTSLKNVKKELNLTKFDIKCMNYYKKIQKNTK